MKLRDAKYLSRIADQDIDRLRESGHRLTDGLIAYYANHDPLASNEESSSSKDYEAQRALELAGVWIESIVGWAFDHVAGLALADQDHAPHDRRDKKGDDVYQARINRANLHSHESEGGKYLRREASANYRSSVVNDRKVLAAVLSHWRFGRTVYPCIQEFSEALTAANLGESREVLELRKGGLRGDALTVAQMQLKAMEHYHYLRGKGHGAPRAKELVEEIFGQGESNFGNWPKRLRKRLGKDRVDNAFFLAKASGKDWLMIGHFMSRRDTSGGQKNPRQEYWESIYGKKIMNFYAKKYQLALKGASRSKGPRGP